LRFSTGHEKGRREPLNVRGDSSATRSVARGLVKSESPAGLMTRTGLGWGAGMIVRRCGLAEEARSARGEVEGALARRGWPYSRRLSLWVDSLLVIEENAK
jgi:hypothetical protein